MRRRPHVPAALRATLGTMVLAGWGWAAAAADLGTVRVGVLEFGTVNWELEIIKENDLDTQRHFELEVQGFASGQATNVALQGGAVDVIVDDWLWVSRQRAEGQMLTFVPFSSTVGALMVPPDSDIANLEDLKGKKVGIVGGPLDKSWLLIQGLAAELYQMDLASVVEPVYGAPPLMNQQIEAGALDAVLTYWHYAARLEAKGFKRLLGVEEAVRELGIKSDVPQLGYVFSEAWAKSNPRLVQAFVDASREAKAILRASEIEWEHIRPLTRAEDDATFEVLKVRFREGIPDSWGEAERADAARLYGILAKLGGEELVGKATELQPGTFWPPVTF